MVESNGPGAALAGNGVEGEACRNDAVATVVRTIAPATIRIRNALATRPPCRCEPHSMPRREWRRSWKRPLTAELREINKPHLAYLARPRPGEAVADIIGWTYGRN